MGRLRQLAEALGDPHSHESHVRNTRKLMSDLSLSQSKLKAEIARREQAENDLAATSAQLETMLYTSDKINPRTIDRLKKHGGGTATAIICMNDWHSEANIEPAVTNYVNEFNLTIAKRRIERTWGKSLYMLDFARKVSNIRDAVLWLGGDLINGYIHRELEESNFLGPGPACRWVAEQIIPGIELLLKEGDLKHITIPCSMGNHGRATEKKRLATAYRTSWEWGLYHNLAMYFRNEPRVTFKIEDGYLNCLEIQKHLVRFHHGDAIKFGGGVGGVHIPLRKKIAQWNKMGRAPILDVLGHFHQMIDEWYYLVSGCLCGFDAFALSIGAEHQAPTQAFAVIDKAYGKVFALPIYCEAA